jgi:hypothetical protein
MVFEGFIVEGGGILCLSFLVKTLDLVCCSVFLEVVFAVFCKVVLGSVCYFRLQVFLKKGFNVKSFCASDLLYVVVVTYVYRKCSRYIVMEF